MKWHPYANLFPMLEEPELQELADDIAANGQHHPVIIDDKGLILDGRNRSEACALAGIEPATKLFKGDDAEKLAFVLSVNLHRRHLDTAQRAMVAEKLAGLKQGEKKADSGIPLSQPTQAEVAKMFNVSVDSVKQARKILKTATPEIVAAVERGELSLNAAVATVKPVKKRAAAEPDVISKTFATLSPQRKMAELRKLSADPDVMRIRGEKQDVQCKQGNSESVIEAASAFAGEAHHALHKYGRLHGNFSWLGKALKTEGGTSEVLAIIQILDSVASDAAMYSRTLNEKTSGNRGDD